MLKIIQIKAKKYLLALVNIVKKDKIDSSKSRNKIIGNFISISKFYKFI